MGKYLFYYEVKYHIDAEEQFARGFLHADSYADAARTVVLHQQGSTSMLQRKYNIGFNRAGRIMDQLCQTGIVGEQDGSKPRQVLCSDEADLEFRLKSLL